MTYSPITAAMYARLAMASTLAVAATTENTQAGDTPGGLQVLGAWHAFLRGAPEECDHFPLAGPAAFWWPGGRLSCPSCFFTASREISGTAEDRTCDLCRTYVPEDSSLVCGSITLQGHVTRDGEVTAPVSISFGLCQRCSGQGYHPAGEQK